MAEREENGDRAGRTTRTLVRGLTLLELISNGTGGVTVTELSARSGLDKGTVSRLLATLRDAGWAHQSDDDRRYRLAGKALALANGSHNQVDLQSIATPALAHLRDEWDEAVHLGRIEGGDVVYVARLEPTSAVRVVSFVGQRVPMHSSAMGRAFLAALPDQQMVRTVQGLRLAQRTPRTITSRPALVKELRACTERGFAIDNEEDNLEVICIGSAITDATGQPVAAISVSGPAYRMRSRIDRIGEACVKVAASISAQLGAPGAEGARR